MEKCKGPGKIHSTAVHDHAHLVLHEEGEAGAQEVAWFGVMAVCLKASEFELVSW